MKAIDAIKAEISEVKLLLKKITINDIWWAISEIKSTFMELISIINSSAVAKTGCAVVLAGLIAMAMAS